MKMKRKLASAVASGLMVVAVVAPMAAAVTQSVGGGSWDHGIVYDGGKQATVYSHYLHPTVWHRASTVNGYKEYSCKTAWKGYWAITAQRAHHERVDRAYWAKGVGC